MLLRSDLAANLRQEVEIIHTEGERAAEITRQLLALSSGRQDAMGRTDLNWVASAAGDRVRAASGGRVQIIERFQQNLPAVAGRPEAMQQLVMNLCEDSMQAICAVGNAGTIELTTASRGGLVFLSVSDNGPGFSPEIEEKIFANHAGSGNRAGHGSEHLPCAR